MMQDSSMLWGHTIFFPQNNIINDEGVWSFNSVHS